MIKVVIVIVTVLLMFRMIYRAFFPTCVRKECDGRLIKIRGLLNPAGFDENYKYVCRSCGTKQNKIKK